MKFILQPLVENAIYHGLEKKAIKGGLFIGTKLEHGLLIIIIQDDGVGINTDNLKRLQAQLQDIPISDGVQHVGILNVQHRIKLQYGMQYGIQIESVENEGTKVTIKIPVNNQINPIEKD